MPAAREARARELLDEHAIDGEIGGFLIGSTVYPGAQGGLADLDLFVVMEDDALTRLPPRRRTMVVIDRGPPRRKEAEISRIPWRQLEQRLRSDLDICHWCYGFAVVLRDQEGRLGPMLAELAVLPEPVRQARRRLHFLELAYCRSKALSRSRAAEPMNVGALVACGSLAAVKLVAVELGSWAPVSHWTEQGLRHLGAPDTLLAQIQRALDGGGAEAVDSLHQSVIEWLDARGTSLHRHLPTLREWLFSEDGLEATRRWGSGVLG